MCDKDVTVRGMRDIGMNFGCGTSKIGVQQLGVGSPGAGSVENRLSVSRNGDSSSLSPSRTA